ncbi:hypothetical protein HMPREF1988_01174, partial [Porphyromonas gingivalis F0185]
LIGDHSILSYKLTLLARNTTPDLKVSEEKERSLHTIAEKHRPLQSIEYRKR